MNKKYLVQGSWLTELPTRAKPSLQLHDEKGKEQAQRVWENHLASLPKICRCEGLKDGAIVEAGKDFEWWDNDGEMTAIPLHREQGEGSKFIGSICSTPAGKSIVGWQDGTNTLPPSPQSEQAGEKNFDGLDESVLTKPAPFERTEDELNYLWDRFDKAGNHAAANSILTRIKEYENWPSPKKGSLSFADIKFHIATIQFNHLSMSASGKAIEANPSSHRIAEWVYGLLQSPALWQAASQEKGVEEGEVDEANDYAERVCSGEFPIEYTREQVVKHTANDFLAGFKFRDKEVEDLNYEIKALTAIKKGLEKSLSQAILELRHHAPPLPELQGEALADKLWSAAVDNLAENKDGFPIMYKSDFVKVIKSITCPAPDTVQGQEENKHDESKDHDSGYW